MGGRFLLFLLFLPFLFFLPKTKSPITVGVVIELGIHRVA